MRRTTLRAVTAGLVAISLVAGLHGLPADAAPRPKPSAPQVDKPARERPVPVTELKPRPGTPDRDGERAVTEAPPVTWPAAGAAEVAVPRPQAAPVSWSSVLSGSPAPAGRMARAGELPVEIGPTAAANRSVSAAERAAAADTPARVRVELLGRSGDQLRLGLRRTDGSARTGTVALRVDYSRFQHAYGGDWHHRLRLVRLPACALTTPLRPDCAAQPLRTRNDGTGTLSADVPATGLFALQAAAAGPTGDSTATSLSPTATWQVGGASGDFNWNYPMKVPPSLGGPKPDLSLAYSSGSLDGRTTAANSQSSWAGAGFELAPGGAIERRYASCAAKSEQTGNNGTKATGDLCWATDNATLTLNGAGGELVRDDLTGSWHTRSDDGLTIQRFTEDTALDLNGDNDDEYWVITDKAGTKYHFGKNKLPGATSSAQDTNSVWTVPVFGNHDDASHPKEPCHQATFAASWCQQAYRWNLDYVVDAHGNTMSLFYDTETNNYARNATATSVSTYTRAGNIKRIEYGQRDGQVFSSSAKVAQVRFDAAERCYRTTDCVPADYPDTPLYLECTSSSDCNNRFYPTFWTKKRLARVTTDVWRGSGFAPVASWTFRHAYLNPGDTRSPLLWLEGITHTGLVGAQQATPETSFGSVMKPNRVVGTDGLPAMNWPRIRTVTYGTGGELAVDYRDPDCALPGNVPAEDDNHQRCHPIKWTPEGQAERKDWFNKYVVSTVTESDLVGGTKPVKTTVDYLTTPAWRFDEEDGLVEVGRKTWSQWRGYEKVKVTKGDGTDGTPEVTVSTYFRGMDGDRRADQTLKTVEVVDSTGAKVRDSDPLSGGLREQTSYDGATVVDRAITDPWISAATATRARPWGTTKSYQVAEQAIRQDQLVTDGRRYSAARNSYSPAGRLLSSSDQKNVADPADDTCTRYEYFDNPSRGIAELPARKQTVDVGCDKPWTTADVLSDERTTYDAGTGAKLATRRLKAFAADGSEIYQNVETTTYDVFGRARTSTNAADKSVSTEYTPAAGGPVTQVKTTLPNGQTAATVLDPAWGEATAVTDQAGGRTDISRDPLGRPVRTWLPGRSRTAAANVETSYSSDPLKPEITTTKTVQGDGSVETSYRISDGLQRKRQTQEPSADGIGWVLTDQIYDSRNQLVKENGPYYAESRPGDGLVVPGDEETIPTRKVNEYDGLGRPTVEQFHSLDRELWRTTHSITADSQTVDPPKGEQATTRITDVQGRPVEVRNYAGDSPTGTPDVTRYTYHPAGQLATVTDAAGNQWKYEYDLRGRKIRDTDPDKGVTSYDYNDLDQVVSSTDARGVTLTYSYDDLGRRRTVSSNATLLSEWIYDTVRPGSLTSATRFSGGNAYTLRYTGYDAAGRPTASQVEIPASEGKLAGTYQAGTTYTADGQVASAVLPGVGGLPAETLTTAYNQANRPSTLSSAADSYVAASEYSPYGELRGLTMTHGDGGVQQYFDYEEGTRRLHRVQTLTPAERVSDVGYSYDPGGNITKITDVPAASTGEATDTQCFGYDQYRRLTQAWTPSGGDCAVAPTKDTLGGPAPYWHSWTFDAIGNRLTEKRTTAAGVTTSSYEYPATGRTGPHAVQRITTTGPGVNRTDQFGYDQAGNLRTRNLNGTTETLSWDAEGRLAASSRNTSFLSDADGNRLIRRDPSGTTLYLGQTELLLKPDGTLSGTRYYQFGDRTIAIRTGNRLTWTGTDHHGTVNLAIDADTMTVTRRRTTPYGELRGATPSGWPGQRGFVGGTNDDATGLVHLGAREYDPVTGRFISVDPVIDFKDPQQLNAYAYANNNPVNFSDADGKRYVTETVTVLKTVMRMITERIVEYKKEVVRITIKIMAYNWIADDFARFGLHDHANRLRGEIVKQVERLRKIVRIVHKLVKDLVRVTKKIQRYVGPAEGKRITAAAMAAARLAVEAIQIATKAMVLPNLSQQGKTESRLGTPFDVGTHDPGDVALGPIGFAAALGGGFAAAAAAVGNGPVALAATQGVALPVIAAFAWNDSNEAGGFNYGKAAMWVLMPYQSLAGSGVAAVSRSIKNGGTGWGRRTGELLHRYTDCRAQGTC